MIVLKRKRSIGYDNKITEVNAKYLIISREIRGRFHTEKCSSGRCLYVNVEKADIVVNNGTIVALDHNHKFQAKEEQDAAGSYVIPGLIDGHIHIESSMLTPGNLVEFYYLMVLPQSSQIHMKSPMSQERKASNLCSMMHKKRIWIFL